jgi:hypothetical protein
MVLVRVFKNVEVTGARALDGVADEVCPITVTEVLVDVVIGPPGIELVSVVGKLKVTGEIELGESDKGLVSPLEATLVDDGNVLDDIGATGLGGPPTSVVIVLVGPPGMM